MFLFLTPVPKGGFGETKVTHRTSFTECPEGESRPFPLKPVVHHGGRKQGWRPSAGVYNSGGSQSVAPGSAALAFPGKWLEMQISGLHPRAAE